MTETQEGSRGERGHAWTPVEITLAAQRQYARPYTDVEVWAEFTHGSGVVVRRPGFWDGGSTWRFRFAAPFAGGRWTWRSVADPADPGLDGQRGELTVADHSAVGNRFHRHGFWRMSP